MTIIHISDTHNNWHPTRLDPADVLVHTGDLSSRGTQAEIENALDWLATTPAKTHIVLPGNHDRYAYDNQDWFAGACKQRGLELLIDRAATIGGLVWYGCNWVHTEPAWNWPREDSAWALPLDALEWPQIITAIPEDIDILVAHSMPLGLCDTVAPGSYWSGLGCVSPGNPWLRQVLDQRQNLKLFLGGHIHENPGNLRYGQTWCSNAARQINVIQLDAWGRVQNLHMCVDGQETG